MSLHGGEGALVRLTKTDLSETRQRLDSASQGLLSAPEMSDPSSPGHCARRAVKLSLNSCLHPTPPTPLLSTCFHPVLRLHAAPRSRANPAASTPVSPPLCFRRTSISCVQAPAGRRTTMPGTCRRSPPPLARPHHRTAARSPSRRRDCHSAAPYLPLVQSGRRYNGDGEGMSANDSLAPNGYGHPGELELVR